MGTRFSFCQKLFSPDRSDGAARCVAESCLYSFSEKAVSLADPDVLSKTFYYLLELFINAPALGPLSALSNLHLQELGGSELDEWMDGLAGIIETVGFF